MQRAGRRGGRCACIRGLVDSDGGQRHGEDNNQKLLVNQ